MALLSRSASLIALAAAAAGLMAAAPTPGASATTLSIDDISCVPNGYQTMFCEAYVSGATGPVTYTWNPTVYFASATSIAWVPCNWYPNAYLTLTVSDGSATATGSYIFDCYEGE
jgi:hypothetical protein